MTTPMDGTPESVAARAGLHYVSDEEPGIQRVRRGRGFSYHHASGRLIRNRDMRRRIEGIAIPPAWTEVWIAKDPVAHIQATGRDDDGRKQYRYHDVWVELRSEQKWARLERFGEALPRIRRRVRRDLRRGGLPRLKVLAILVRLLDLTGIRIGSREALQRKGSHGLTTLRRRHVDFDTNGAVLHFRGKGGADIELSFTDPRLGDLLRDCEELPGHEVFQYLDIEGAVHSVTARDVNGYIQEMGGQEFSAKDFRTWVGSMQAFLALDALPPADTEPDRRRNLAHALDLVAETLRNTPAVCREFYVHPLLTEGYLDGRLVRLLDRIEVPKMRDLRKAERTFLALLRAS